MSILTRDLLQRALHVPSDAARFSRVLLRLSSALDTESAARHAAEAAVRTRHRLIVESDIFENTTVETALQRARVVYEAVRSANDSVDCVLAVDPVNETLYDFYHVMTSDDLDPLTVSVTANDAAEVKQDEQTHMRDQFNFTVLGGTFDQLHVGHKLLLTAAALLSSSSMYCGVTDYPLDDKHLSVLMLTTQERMRAVREFLQIVRPSLDVIVESIPDPYGPTINDRFHFDCFVASSETKRGVDKIGQMRDERKLPPLSNFFIDLISSSSAVDDKASSTEKRHALLGRLMREPKKTIFSAGSRLYRIGLTGGIASGKTSMAKRLAQLPGVVELDADKLGHEVYLPGTAAFNAIKECFGSEVIDDTGNIERRRLGSIVFADPAQMEKLCSIVWPEIAKLTEQRIAQFAKDESVQIVVIEAAVLLEAGWDQACHEVWTCVVPEELAIERLKERNNLSRNEAKKRINSQHSDAERVQKSHLVLGALLDVEDSVRQCHEALEGARVRAATWRECSQWERFASDVCTGDVADIPSIPAVPEHKQVAWQSAVKDALSGMRGRAYHSPAHVAALIRHVLAHWHMCHQVHAVLCCALFHDAIYDSTCKDNEEQSALLWLQTARDCEISVDFAEDVASMIRSTATHTDPSMLLTTDAEFFLDIDLAILGAPSTEQYDAYAKGVREEYAHFSPEAFRQGRCAVLERFKKALNANALFRTPVLAASLEDNCRANLQRELNELLQ
ncbi:MAG: hypothetical protein MHM6MM_000866 [Cercozoa sp. M6MM]